MVWGAVSVRFPLPPREGYGEGEQLKIMAPSAPVGVCLLLLFFGDGKNDTDSNDSV
jgi:hypothetical protein